MARAPTRRERTPSARTVTRSSKRAAAAGPVLTVLYALAFVLALRATFLALTHRAPLRLILGLKFHALWVGLGLAAALVVACARRERLRRRSGEPCDSPLAVARGLFVVAVCGWLLFVWRVQPFQRLWFDLALGGAAGAWAGLRLLRWELGGHTARLGRVLGSSCFGLCAAALALELGLRAWAHVRPGPLNTRVGSGPRELIERFRCAPGLVHHGFACNSRGFYDDEPEEQRRSAAEANAPWIVAIGDSFNVGMVPHAWHFTTVCEELSGARIYNVGVAGIGPAEYVRLLVDEALPLEPDRILIGVFLGNDLNVVDVLEGLPDPGLRAWLQRDQVLLFVLPERLARLRAERTRRAANAPEREPWTARNPGPEAAAAAFPWLADPSLERPTYSTEAFLDLETKRALAICTGTPVAFDLFRRSMLAARRAAGDIPLHVMLIPDEFQVEDPLWELVEQRAGRPLERTRAQRLLTAWLAQQKIPYLDLLPALRRVPPGPDGRRHVYHERDTHFNARGNRVAAEALAEFLAEL